MVERVDGLLHEATRPAGKPALSPEVIARVVEMTLAEPPGERTHWTGRAMATAAGSAIASVQRIWAAHGLKPPSCRMWHQEFIRFLNKINRETPTGRELHLTRIIHRALVVRREAERRGGVLVASATR